MEDDNNNMLLVDRADGLAMYHHRPDADTPLPKGIIVDEEDDDKAVLLHTSVWSREIPVEEFDASSDGIDYATAVVITSEEGTLLRVYNHGGAWRVSTHRKLDASRSRWGCAQSFYELFVEALGGADACTALFARLDPKYVYTFLVRSNEYNRLVCRAPAANEPAVLFSGKYPLYPYPATSSLPIPIPCFDGWTEPSVPAVTRHDCSSGDDLAAIARGMSCYAHPGVIVFHGKGVLKVLAPGYMELRSLRNNCPDIMVRYAQLRKGPGDEQMRFVELYANFMPDFEQFEYALVHIALFVSMQYINRYVRNEYATVSPLLYRIVKKMREWYLENPTRRRVSPSVARQFIESEPHMYIFSIVDEYLYGAGSSTAGVLRGGLPVPVPVPPPPAA